MQIILFIVGIVVGVAILFLSPLALIWSLNTLFPVLAIPLGWETYWASMFILICIGGTLTLKQT